MLQHKRVGLIIWGAILTAIGFIMFVSGAADGIGALIIIGLMILAGGILMLAFGIVNAVKVTKYNNDLINDGKSYTTNCVKCGRVISAQTKDFRPHGRFPEGFIYCPVCKAPISKNAFTEYDAAGNIIKEGAPQSLTNQGYQGQFNQYNYYGQQAPGQIPQYGSQPYPGQPYQGQQYQYPQNGQPYQGQYQNPQNNNQNR